jgi:tRNA U34 5-methylaminomethyl-2-thiouridine-forming methyltransferase MnmC
MERKLILTKDGSHSIHIPELGVNYHSIYGAVQESLHVFIDAGLKPLLIAGEELRVFEMGFGTGLNALLTLLHAEKEKKKIYYHAVEAFPLDKKFIEEINYCRLLDRPDLQDVFEKLHSSAWEEDKAITSYFVLHKINIDFNYYSADGQFHIIYYDAFDPNAQPALWTKPIFQKLFMMLIPGGSLLTYCSKGSVRRMMQEAGFVVEKLPGPAHKREIIKAKK